METKKSFGFQGKQFFIWLAALIIGVILGFVGYKFGLAWLNNFFNFIASAYTRLFQFVAVPTIALAVTTTLTTLGTKKDTGKIFLHTICYTLLTTFLAAFVGLFLYKVIAPGNLPVDTSATAAAEKFLTGGSYTFYDHILKVIPNNILQPFIAGNVLSILLVAAAVGLCLAVMPETENKQVLVKGIFGLQDLLFSLIKALVWTLPFGIVAFTAQLVNDLGGSAGSGQLLKYVAVVIGGNLIQFFIVLPLFMLIRGVNPLKIFHYMLPAVLMALFTKSSAATLPVTVASAENNMKAESKVARFILPMCCTINMNGCAAFIFVTSLFVMQNNGVELTMSTMLLWVCIAVISAVGNAGVPMGCYFLTLSLMAGNGMSLWIMGVILPVYAVIDMIETAENVWSDCCICSVVNKELYPECAQHYVLGAKE